MNWIPVTNQPAALLQEFRLMQNTDCKITLKYNPHQHSARLTSDDKQHRLFYFETAGTANSKILVLDQYGMERGNISFDKMLDTGTVIFEGRLYYFQVKYSAAQPVITIFKNRPAQPWVSCSYNISGDNALNMSFVLGLCWYVQIQQEKENLVEYAA